MTSATALPSFDKKLIERKAYIGGNFLDLSSSDDDDTTVFDVTNPYTGKVFAQSANCNESHAKEALEKALRSTTWKSTTSSTKERYEKLRRWATVVRNNSVKLAELLTEEQGKVYKESMGEVMQGAIMIDWFAEEARRIHGEVNFSSAADKKDFILKSPVGVVLAITPWNFPFIGPIVKCAAALAAGCSVILKPSEETPLIAMALAFCAHRAKAFDDGQFSVLPCSDPSSVCTYLLQSTDVRMVTFTGSTNVGKYLYAECAFTMKRTQFECGGNAPFIVFDDASLDVATNCAKGARFYNNGQICLGANRIFVHATIYDDFVTMYKDKVLKLKTGNGMNDDIHTGPVINRKSLQKIQALIQDALEKGAKLVCGGSVCTEVLDSTTTDGQLNFQPTILQDTTREMDIYKTEIFGPVACIYKFDGNDDDDIIRIANETPYGLAAYVFSSSSKRLWNLSERLEAGMIGANTTDITSEDLPFGGIKQSGFGREGGRHCLDEYLVTKVFSLQL